MKYYYNLKKLYILSCNCKSCQAEFSAAITPAFSVA